MTLRLVGQRLERPPDRRAVLASRAAPPACTCRTRAAARRSPTCSAARSTRRSRTSTRCSSTSRPASCARSPSPATKRSPVLPDVPTHGRSRRQERRRLLLAGASPRPRACRPTCATKLHDAVVAALNDPQVKQQLTGARPRDRRQHAGAVRRLPAAGVRALEEGDRGRARSPPTDARRRPTSTTTAMTIRPPPSSPRCA